MAPSLTTRIGEVLMRLLVSSGATGDELVHGAHGFEPHAAGKGLNPIWLGNDHVSDLYLGPLAVLQLLLILIILCKRVGQLRRPALRTSGKPLPQEDSPSLLWRLPHLLFSLLLVAKPLALIACDEVMTDMDAIEPADPSKTEALYKVCAVCSALMWAVCAAIVLAEQRHGRHTCLALRLWWLLNTAIASVTLSSDVVRIYGIVRRHEALEEHGWLLMRLASFVPSLGLGIIALLARDTPPDDADDAQPFAATVRGGINASTPDGGPHPETGQRGRELWPLGWLTARG